jgi:hypothetical protein
MVLPWSMIVEAGGLILVAIVMWFAYRSYLSRPYRRLWMCVRFHGGGRVMTPKPMSVDEVTEWLGRIHGEVSHVDQENGFVFYRPRGGG